MNPSRCFLFLLVAFVLRPAGAADLTVNLRSRVEALKGSGDWRAVSLEQSLPVERTAVLICDMWDKHWCSGATERINGLVVKMAPFLDVTIAIEPLNRFETSFLNTVADTTQLASEIGHPQVGVLFDTFHANIEEIDVAAALRSAVPHLKHVHASENNRGIPGTGHTDWSRVIQTLHDVNYEDWVTIESFVFALGELSVAASIWRDLAPHAEDVAFQGVQFLRAGLA
jgi:sugar phosphate isomerase/epimerase